MLSMDTQNKKKYWVLREYKKDRNGSRTVPGLYWSGDGTEQYVTFAKKFKSRDAAYAELHNEGGMARWQVCEIDDEIISVSRRLLTDMKEEIDFAVDHDVAYCMGSTFAGYYREIEKGVDTNK